MIAATAAASCFSLSLFFSRSRAAMAYAAKITWSRGRLRAQQGANAYRAQVTCIYAAQYVGDVQMMHAGNVVEQVSCAHSVASDLR